jgi:ATP-binding cassette subfamily F protein 3
LAKASGTESGGIKSLGSRKERRREEADARNRQSALKKPILAKLQAIEKRLGRLQVEKERIEETLAQTHLYEDGAKEELIGYLHDQAVVSREINNAEEEWLRISSELEQLKI